MLAQANPSYWKAPLPLSLPPRASLSEDVIGSSRYGLSYPLDPALKKEIEQFCTWSSNVVQLDRGGSYVAPAQAITVEGHEAHIIAFLGFVHLSTGMDLSGIRLPLYEEPSHLMSFTTFLKVRSQV
jgi:hypothetical protein